MQPDLSPLHSQHQRRIRHITGLRIHNLSPFPRRDRLAAPPRHIPLDTADDNILPRRPRRRRTSAASSSSIVAPANSQAALQSIVAARLVHSFITLSPLRSAPLHQPKLPPSPPTSAPPFNSSFAKSTGPPVYFSPVHRPSTNPYFPIDTRSPRDFPPPYDLSAQSLHVQVWGNPPAGWSLLNEWHFHLNQLLPLPEDVTSLPPNTLLVSLSPPGNVFYLPHPSDRSRSPSPSHGYSSEPESEIRNPTPLRRRRHHNPAQSSTDTLTKTAGLQDLFKLVNIQSCILDNEASVSEVIRGIGHLLEDDSAFSQRRHISESEARIQDLRRNHDTVREQCAQKRAQIIAYKQRLQQRSDLLESARIAFDINSDLTQVIANERAQLTALHAHMTSIRTSLLSTLSTIFPIELLSPPDLLFTILDVPLPIPVNPSDPAPPLTLPEHKEVTEEAVAAALGFVAQVLQILAAYLGKGLVYPVTCIGSRSLIRDGISAMVGPRMFPLFSKGVDTYRFEYGVFLLNKDIEMLMSERDLRALDIRHTLPNLKNLMLTLSHDNIPTTTRPVLRRHSPILSISSGLATPSRSSSPPNEDMMDVSTPKASQIITPIANGDQSRSGATTPTASLHDTTKSKSSFLGFGVPFWGRSSTIQREEEDSVSSSEDSSDDAPGADDEEGDGDEDDRRTIHGVVASPSDNLINPVEVGGQAEKIAPAE
ncbi:UV radiation resistance-associated protein [Psilocybe cubensis]|uniref:UV radiation resistance-associated protein n=2 Tax=Psilocybe cubensis TaxID=181762 RepID=A0ACB8HFY0_PSICU|nr:UV radiation resistance-associated protein [Psilocybe cubensis]KAH9486703.1 UV radiation resistance-associated protein [Psilocybe cubensis]